MSITSQENITLLLSCIQHSAAGKIDFATVARECNITSAGAAAKRFSRLTKSHRESMAAAGDIAGASNEPHAQSSDPTTTTTGDNDQNKNQAAPAKASRKRKAPAVKKEDADEAGTSAQPPAKTRKTTGTSKGKGKGKTAVKMEKEEEEEDDNAHNIKGEDKTQDDAGEEALFAGVKVKEEGGRCQEEKDEEDMEAAETI
ncbi:hypothetical protein BJY04DRAFT_215376 [Aspergillus karnatakaensis]|uniref:uncharacterized protein n=1 Tax=Aspergillus karnatakaensis TaxID=1810916 RepID=UPI003CCDC6A8